MLKDEFSVITLLGPRQAGKTTLARSVFPTHSYVNLEDPQIRELAIEDPNGFFSTFKGNLILDEIQRAPILLSKIQVLIDEEKTKGRFVLTGSHQLELNQPISQSLAGRTAICKLLPLSLRELQSTSSLRLEACDYIFKGFMPAIYGESIQRIPTYYRSYFQTYVERDVRQMINVKDQIQFEKFIRLCAGRIGQILDYSSLANDVGVTTKTVQNWISILEASFVVFRVSPYFENFGRRLIKSPKLYFTDTGLASYLLGIESKDSLRSHPLKGLLFENMVISDLIKTRENSGSDPHLYFYRDTNGNEVDAIFAHGDRLTPIEIKSSESFTPEFLKGLKHFGNVAKQRSTKGVVIYGGSVAANTETYLTLNFQDAFQALELEQTRGN